MCAQGLGWEQAESLLGGPGSRHSGVCLQTWWGRRRSHWTAPSGGAPDGSRMALPTRCPLQAMAPSAPPSPSWSCLAPAPQGGSGDEVACC